MAVQFGIYEIPAEEVFWRGQHTFGMVNIRPFLPYHLLLSPYRQVRYFAELDESELAELMQMSARISQTLNSGRSRIAIQDGPDAGQSVFHTHVHIIPWTEDTQQVHIDAPVADRAKEDMAKEADYLRTLFSESP